MPKRIQNAVVSTLNDVLTAELTAINQYFVHAEMCEHWGYARLHASVRKQAIDEMKHAEVLIERILDLGGIPNVQRMGKVSIGETVREQLDADLALEQEALPRLNESIALCREEDDNTSRRLLEDILESEENHVAWIEAQLGLIGQVGEPNYLAQQIRESEEE